MFVHEEIDAVTKKVVNETWGCDKAPPHSWHPWHIPESPMNFNIPDFDRHFLAANCGLCDETEEFEYTKTRGLGGPLPEREMADEQRDLWMFKHSGECKVYNRT
ncbi:hypothetical protein [Streptomyces atratus]|uniref:hypothetical protein n=1 Tax=Streptomyces atratus TaxID=1893 RepID=UPI003656ACE1